MQKVAPFPAKCFFLKFWSDRLPRSHPTGEGKPSPLDLFFSGCFNLTHSSEEYMQHGNQMSTELAPTIT